jgi:hypothetical protein
MRIALFLFIVVYTSNIFAQSSISPDFQLLRLSNGEIRQNDTINERIIDLVSVGVLDSVITKKRQHHRLFFVGWAISTFAGYNWRPLNFTKQKIVGTVERASRSNEAEFTEHDVNFDMYFNTQKYLQKAFQGYDRQGEIKRQDFRRGKHLKDYTVPPFKRDTHNIDKWEYRIHAELTPPAAFRQQLNLLFYPVFHNQSLATHPNVQDPKPTIGVYGVYCSDCNHSCQPELHPYEWIWWLKTSDSLSINKQWTACLFHESSNRFPDWSSSPKIGTIAIPFSFDVTKKGTIKFETITFDELIPNGAFAFVPKSEISYSMDFEQKLVNIPLGKKGYDVKITNSLPIPSNGLQYWIETIGYDAEKQTINGCIHFSIATRSLFAFKVTMGEE